VQLLPVQAGEGRALMGITTRTVQQYSCDVCRKDIPESEVFSGDRMALWGDRDVVATAAIELSVVIPYASRPRICCKACAGRLIRQFADRLGAPPADQS
jgi:hypothetical protein